ncbi:MAG: PEP/pyruvate-binding domain-containing protein [Acidimicrobiales bacterium]
MNGVVPLSQARDEKLFGAKAVGLGAATRADLVVPPGIALSGELVEKVAGGDQAAVDLLTAAVGSLGGPLAARSSCVDEDGAEASFAGQHLTILNVASKDDLAGAVREIWWSANSDSAIGYRRRVGLFSRPSVGVVVQVLLDPEVAGVMFTTNPINGADERVIEAAFGLGEAVVAGLVIPDHYRLTRSGDVLEASPGVKKIAIRAAVDGGTREEKVDPELVERLCIGDAELEQLSALAGRCEEVYGPGRDIEWAFSSGRLYLLQCRAVTKAVSRVPTASSDAEAVGPGGAVATSLLARVPLFGDLDADEADQVAGLFKERRFCAGETIVKEGASGAAFFVIGTGEATVSIRARPIRTLGPGDYFGEIALIDEGARSATVTATTDLVCHGLTLWDFQPLVQQNPAISWKLLQALAKKLRGAQGTA